MSEWLTYRLSDFLMYSPRTYYRLVELYNAAVWPLQLVAFILGLLIIVLVFRNGRSSARFVAGALSICWLWVAWAFLHQRYASINWAADYIAFGFAIESVLLLILSLGRGDRIVFHWRRVAGLAGIALIAFAVVLQPFVGPVSGKTWSQVETFGVMPDPTVVATLGVLLLMRGRARTAAMIIPVAWCLASGATAWTMGEYSAFMMPLIAVMSVGSAVFAGPNRKADF